MDGSINLASFNGISNSLLVTVGTTCNPSLTPVSGSKILACLTEISVCLQTEMLDFFLQTEISVCLQTKIFVSLWRGLA